MEGSEGVPLEKWIDESWIVDILRSSGQPLGIALTTPPTADQGPADRRPLIVRHVSTDSAAGRWNGANPELAIQQGDRIVEVNGHHGTAGMLRFCEDANVLRLVLLREAVEVDDCELALSIVQDVLQEASFSYDAGSESDDDSFAWSVEGTDPVSPKTRKALAESPYVVAPLPEGKPRQGKNKRRRRPQGFRACCMQPPELQEILSPTRKWMRPEQQPLPSSPLGWQQPGKVQNLRPLRERKIHIGAQYEVLGIGAENPLAPPTWHRPPSPPRVPGGLLNACALERSIRPPDSPMKQRQRPLPQGLKLRPRQDAHAMDLPERGSRHMVAAPGWTGQLGGSAAVTLPRLEAGEDKCEKWRKNMANTALHLARMSDTPLGLLSKMG